MKRSCNLDKCDNYRGFETGYCHKYQILLRDDEKKDFFARNCGDHWDLEALEVMWSGEERSKAWDPES